MRRPGTSNRPLPPRSCRFCLTQRYRRLRPPIVWVASYTMFYGCVERPEIASPAVMSWRPQRAVQNMRSARRATRDCQTITAGTPTNSKAIAAMKTGCGRPVVRHETTRAGPPIKSIAVKAPDESSVVFDPPKIGSYQVISPRTCPDCPTDSTVWRALAMDGYTPDMLSAAQRATIDRTLGSRARSPCPEVTGAGQPALPSGPAAGRRARDVRVATLWRSAHGRTNR
jgi:hypothetical protein